MIRATDVTKRYGPFTAVDQASFEVGKGRVAGFLGLNGAGKTTTMRIISCFMPPSSGSVQVGGSDTVRESEAVRRRIGYLPERVPIYDDMRIEEYLSFRARLKGVRGRAVRERVDEVIDRCDLGPKRRSLNGTLSKGYRQRVGLADSLVHDPDLLILDEPTSGLDPDQRLAVRGLVREIGKERTVLLSTHLLVEAEAVCDDIIIIHRGQIKACDTQANLKREYVDGQQLIHTGDALADYGSEPLKQPEADSAGAATALLLADRAGGTEAARRAIAAGREIIELRPRARSLEEVFIAITSGREEAP